MPDGDEFFEGESSVDGEADVGTEVGGAVIDLAVADGGDDVGPEGRRAPVDLPIADGQEDVRVEV